MVAASVARRDMSVEKEKEKLSDQKISVIKKELQNRCINIKGLLEKSELIQALAEARVDGEGDRFLSPNFPANSTKPSTTSTSAKPSTSRPSTSYSSTPSSTSSANRSTTPTRPSSKVPSSSTQARPTTPTKTKAKVSSSSTKSPSSSSKPKVKSESKAAKPPKSSAPNKPAPIHEVVMKSDNYDFSNADPSKWKLSEVKFAGAAQYESLGRQEEVAGKSIQDAIKKFKKNPTKYTALLFQGNMLDWPVEKHKYTLIHRDGTVNWVPQGTSPSGWLTAMIQEYEVLPRFPDNQLPKKYRDKYTDKLTFNGKKIKHHILPGRGMGHGDTPSLKIIGDVDPSDISQGAVGDCWLLSGISSLAEFDGAVKRLFRKTKHLSKLPRDKPNTYTVTLWDLAEWKEVDIVIDERLCAHPSHPDKLLASKPSIDGELWVCYLEKALAIHCGGWDKITGGQCTHAWALMTGCREQYAIYKNKKTGKYQSYSKFDPNTKTWARDANSPHDCVKAMWPSEWPKVGGGGGVELELDEDELFKRFCAWDRVNFIMGAGTTGTSDKHSTGGMVDNHAYSVIECRENVCGTGIDLIKVRNPWGSGEIEDGQFDDDGPGWDQYPQIKKELNPVVADDGIFWVTKTEFFRVYDTFYLSASNMTEFLED